MTAVSLLRVISDTISVWHTSPVYDPGSNIIAHFLKWIYCETIAPPRPQPVVSVQTFPTVSLWRGYPPKEHCLGTACIAGKMRANDITATKEEGAMMEVCVGSFGRWVCRCGAIYMLNTCSGIAGPCAEICNAAIVDYTLQTSNVTAAGMQ